jgi:hypothetical protein
MLRFNTSSLRLPTTSPTADASDSVGSGVGANEADENAPGGRKRRRPQYFDDDSNPTGSAGSAASATRGGGGGSGSGGGGVSGSGRLQRGVRSAGAFSGSGEGHSVADKKKPTRRRQGNDSSDEEPDHEGQDDEEEEEGGVGSSDDDASDDGKGGNGGGGRMGSTRRGGSGRSTRALSGLKASGVNEVRSSRRSSRGNAANVKYTEESGSEEEEDHEETQPDEVRGRSSRRSTSKISQSLHEQMGVVIDSAMANDKYEVFSYPVDAESAPGYLEIVQRPIDFSKIRCVVFHDLVFLHV